MSSNVRPLVSGKKKSTSGREAKWKEPKTMRVVHPSEANIEGMTKVQGQKVF